MRHTHRPTVKTSPGRKTDPRRDQIKAQTTGKVAPNSKRKEQTRKRMRRDLAKIITDGATDQHEEIPFSACYSLKLPGVILDCQKIFEEHAKELKKKLTGEK